MSGDKFSIDPMKCRCLHWASERPRAAMLGNGHHPDCMMFIPDVGGIDLLGQLVEGIEAWAAQEDGVVPDWLWDAYSKAVFIVRGKAPESKEVQS